MNSTYQKKQLITKMYKKLMKFSKKENSFRTLMYHSIFDDTKEEDNDDIYKLGFSLFKRQINYLKKIKNYKIITANKLIDEIPSKGLSITFDDGYFDNYSLAAPYLIENEIPFTIFVITNFIRNNKKGYMSEKNIKELSKNSLVSIGSHTVNHYRLTDLDSNLVSEELNYSKSYLEDLLGKKIEMLSYPYGKYNKSIEEKVSEIGYKIAFSSKFYINKKNQNKLSLCRNEIWNNDEIQIFEEKLNGDWDWLRFAQS